MRFFLTLAAVLLAFRAAGAEEAPPALKVTTSWYGNTFGTPDKWVQMAADAMFTAPDGTCYLNTFWDEGGREVGIYRDGDVVGIAGHTHGWGYNGGYAVAANDQYLFIAQVADNEGGGLKAADTWPPKGKVWHGISRRTRDGKPAPFAGGKGGSGDTLKSCFLVLDEADPKEPARITGLAAGPQRLYAASEGENAIRVIEIATMTVQAKWPVPRPDRLCLAGDGSLWVLQAGEKAGAPARIVHLSAEGKPLPQQVTGVAAPTALALDAKGRLLVADNGPDQQVKIFAGLDRKPALVGTLGVKGGVLAGRRGQVGPLRFNDLRGVGADARGNTYVCCNGNGFGMTLECYSPAGKRLWQLVGLEFVDVGDLDPASDTDLYTKDTHYRMDWSQPGAGREWRQVGYTLDRFATPDEARAGHAEWASTWCRRIRGKLFVFGVDMYSHHLLVYRKGPDELLVPAGILVNGRFNGDWPANQPAKCPWIWRDANGDGRFDAGEFETGDEKLGGGWGWWVDANGDVWRTTGANQVLRLPLQGLDAKGNPVYTYAKAQVMPCPAPLNRLERVQYVPATDTLYLSGYTAELANTRGNWKTIGKVLCRYDHWSTAPAKAWDVAVPFDEAQERSTTYGTPVAMQVEGDYAFIVYLRTAEVRVLDARTGTWVGVIRPEKDLSGWVDIPYGINVHRRANGEYVILAEEDWKAKGLVYRWRP